MPQLHLIDNAQKPPYELTKGETLVVGRDDECDITIDDPYLSRRHCQLMWDGEIAFLEDLDSNGGVFVEGDKIDNHVIQHGQVITIGQTNLRYVLDPNPSQTLGAGPATPPPARFGPEVMLGKSIAHYKIESIIAAGKNGFVYKAENTETGEAVAFKLFPPSLGADQEGKDRFIRAMQTMIPIDHPNIVKIYNAGKTGEHCWIAMEYVEGMDLATLISTIGIDGKLEWQAVWHTALQVAYGLREAFNHSIIHRNLLPSNLLRRKEDKMVLIGDVMLAKALEGEHSRNITKPGQLVGELPYMAPECLDTNLEIDTRSDIYSLGATLYALLTGRPPAEGESTSAIVKKVRGEEPERPSVAQIGIHEMFEDLVMEMVSKDPGARPGTPDQLIQRLVRIANYANIRY